MVVVAYTWAGLKQCVVVPPVCCECQPESHGWEHMIPATSSPGIGTHPASSWQTWNAISNHKSTVSLQLWLAVYTKSLAPWSAEKLTWHSKGSAYRALLICANLIQYTSVNSSQSSSSISLYLNIAFIIIIIIIYLQKNSHAYLY